jgi:hypothetical protein
MIWGSIAKTGHRTQLVRCPKSVNGTTYQQMLDDIKVIPEFKQVFKANGLVWEQDNAPVHKPSRSYPAMQMNVLSWPPKSPDLSPVEQCWSILKDVIAGRIFQDDDKLFAALKKAWDQIPNSTIENLRTSLEARLKTCLELNGECLNGH